MAGRRVLIYGNGALPCLCYTVTLVSHYAEQPRFQCASVPQAVYMRMRLDNGTAYGVLAFRNRSQNAVCKVEQLVPQLYYLVVKPLKFFVSVQNRLLSPAFVG